MPSARASRSGRADAIQSMTGYGRASVQAERGSITVELRSTNHRYLEIDVRLPSGLTPLQARIAEAVRGHVRRGRVEAQVGVQLDRWDQRRVAFDEPLLGRYHSALRELQSKFGIKGPLTLDHLLALPQALTVVEERVPAERLWEPVRRATEAAAKELVRARRREGAKLVADIRNQLKAIDQHLRAVRRRLPKAMAAQRRRLRERLTELLGPESAVTTSQLEQAVALVRDTDVNEELVRLETHVAYVRQNLQTRQLVGKRLDFIAQELMREANTMGAKANDPEAAQHVVDVKSCIEKIREQVQNLE
jgi:uncharacterized protein (TIGR00255 family)